MPSYYCLFHLRHACESGLIIGFRATGLALTVTLDYLNTLLASRPSHGHHSFLRGTPLRRILLVLNTSFDSLVVSQRHAVSADQSSGQNSCVNIQMYN